VLIRLIVKAWPFTYTTRVVQSGSSKVNLGIEPGIKPFWRTLRIFV